MNSDFVIIKYASQCPHFPNYLVVFVFIYLFIFGLAAWLAGSQFPDQELNLGHCNESAES